MISLLNKLYMYHVQGNKSIFSCTLRTSKFLFVSIFMATLLETLFVNTKGLCNSAIFVFVSWRAPAFPRFLMDDEKNFLFHISFHYLFAGATKEAGVKI